MADVIKILAQLEDQITGPAKKIEQSIENINKKAQLLTQWSAKLHTTTGKLTQGLQLQGLAINKTGRVFDVLTGRIVETGKAMKKASALTQGFKMHFLGIMFFGMMLQRVFMGIAKQGVDTFMKITQGQTEAGQAVTALSANFQFLQFAIGDAIASALLPLLPTFVAIIEAMVDFISQNQGLVAGIIGLGGVLGTVFMTGGALYLGIASLKGFKEAFTLSSTAANTLSDGLSKLGVSISGGGGLIGTLTTLGFIALIVVGVYILWQTIAAILNQTLFDTRTEIEKQIEDLEQMETVGNRYPQFLNDLGTGFGTMKGTITDADFRLKLFNQQIAGAKEPMLLKKQTEDLSKAMGLGLNASMELITETSKTLYTREELMNEMFGDATIKTNEYAESVTDLNRQLTELQARMNATGYGFGVTDVGGLLGGKQIGGFINKTGAYMMHKGEYVVPQNSSMGGGNQISVVVNTGPISSDIDIHDLADKVASRISDSIKLYTNPTATKFV